MYTEDIIAFNYSGSYNLIENNVLENCKHSVVFDNGLESHHQIYRNNIMINKHHNVLDVWAAGANLAKGAQYLIEGNQIIGSAKGPKISQEPCSAFQYGSKGLVIRHNLISFGGGKSDNQTIGALVGATSTTHGKPYAAVDCRIYHNTEVKTQGVINGMYDFGQQNLSSLVEIDL